MAQYGKKDDFWQYTDELFSRQSTLSEGLIKSVAQSLGLSEDELASCASDPLLAERIKVDTDAAEALGGTGTPFTVIIYPDNTYKTVSGAVPLEQWQSLIAPYEQ